MTEDQQVTAHSPRCVVDGPEWTTDAASMDHPAWGECLSVLPRDYVEGVIRWQNRVAGYAFILVTDQYPPFRLHA